MYKKCELKSNDLTRHVNLNRFSFKTTADIKVLDSVIGQNRAVSAIHFALEMNDTGYNLFVTGHYGTGKSTIISDLLHRHAKNQPEISDWVFVFNFDQPDEPKAIELPNGKACAFQQEMQKLISRLKTDLRKAFESKNYLARKNEIIESVQAKKQEVFLNLDQEAQELNVHIQNTEIGIVAVPRKEDKVLDKTAFNALPESEKEAFNNNVKYIQKRAQEALRLSALYDRELEEKVDELDTEVARFVVDNHFSLMLENYQDQKDIIAYLNAAADDITKDVYNFIGVRTQDKGLQPGAVEREFEANKYRINVLIDNSRVKGAAVVHEMNPTYNNLFGRIEKKSYQGYLYTDYTMIKAGSLLAANGGYLILDAEQLLKQPFSYEALKRALRSRELRIEDVYELSGYASTVSLKPQSIPLNLKVVLIGSSYVYSMLHHYDQQFRKIFKARADFDTEVKDTASTQKKYLQFIARVVQEEKLLHFDRSGVEAIITYGHRSADNQKKLSIQFGEIVKIIREASYWAGKKRKKTVTAEHVRTAIEEKNYRQNLTEERIDEAILEHTINVDVSGFKVGQVNGLAVYSMGDFAFGRPSRITINTFTGTRGIINIEREAKLSGKIHDKGMLVLSGYFSEKFGTTMPLSFSASITFEQSYGMIDGDSASSTELYGLLSSLSGVPINQGIAVTGSVNQKGDVQAIGGVNEKVEGFFTICKARGLTGKQGVIIPKANVKNLILNKDVIEAVQKNKFNVWAVDHIEDGIRILTGVPCGILHKDGSYTKDSIFMKVQERLREFAQKAHLFRKSLDADIKKSEDNILPSDTNNNQDE